MVWVVSGEGGGHLDSYKDTTKCLPDPAEQVWGDQQGGPSMTQYTLAKTMHNIEALLSLPPAHRNPSLTAENQAAGPAQEGEGGGEQQRG